MNVIKQIVTNNFDIVFHNLIYMKSIIKKEQNEFNKTLKKDID